MQTKIAQITEMCLVFIYTLCNELMFIHSMLVSQGTKIFKYCTCPAGLVTYNFHSYCNHRHLSFKSICNKEHKGVICNMTSSSNSSCWTSAQISLVITSRRVEFLSPVSSSIKYLKNSTDCLFPIHQTRLKRSYYYMGENSQFPKS